MTILAKMKNVLFYLGQLKIHSHVFSQGTQAQHLTLSVSCVCVMCGVPWIDAMLRSVNETTVQSKSVCTGVQYRCTHSDKHNIVMNRPGLLA